MNESKPDSGWNDATPSSSEQPSCINRTGCETPNDCREHGCCRSPHNKEQPNAVGQPVPAAFTEKLAHIDHPLRHWDRTCPACVAEGRSEKLHEAPTPRTDQVSTLAIRCESDADYAFLEMRAHARQLERELAATRAMYEFVASLPSASVAMAKLEGFMGVVEALKDVYWVERDHRGIEYKHPAISPAIAAYAEEVDAFLRSPDKSRADKEQG